MNDNITDEVVATAERIEEYDSLEDIDPLDVKLTVELDGTVREVLLVLTVGGPYLEVNATNGTVYGSWGGETHRTHVNNEELLDRLHDYYSRHFEENTVVS